MEFGELTSCVWLVLDFREQIEASVLGMETLCGECVSPVLRRVLVAVEVSIGGGSRGVFRA